METVSISVKCTREEYLKFSVDRVERPWFPGVVGAVMIVMSGVLQAVSDYDITAPMMLLMVCGIMALLFSPLFLMFWHKSEAAKRYDNADSLQQAITLTMNKDCINVRTSCHDGILPLSLVTAVDETDGAIGITFGKELELCIPKRVLTDEEWQTVKDIVCKIKKDNAL